MSRRKGIKWETKEFKVLLARCKKGARDALVKQVKRNAVHVKGEGQKRCPQDLGHLQGSAFEQSLPAKVVRVMVGFNEIYAAVMHEGDYNLGERSEEKQFEMGVVVGRKYLTRAIDDNAKKYHESNAKAVKTALVGTRK